MEQVPGIKVRIWALKPFLMLSIIGLAYFLPSNISFSMGVGPIAMCVISGVLMGYGVSIREGDHMSMKMDSFLFAGGYFGS